MKTIIVFDEKNGNVDVHTVSKEEFDRDSIDEYITEILGYPKDAKYLVDGDVNIFDHHHVQTDTLENVRTRVLERFKSCVMDNCGCDVVQEFDVLYDSPSENPYDNVAEIPDEAWIDLMDVYQSCNLDWIYGTTE